MPYWMDVRTLADKFKKELPELRKDMDSLISDLIKSAKASAKNIYAYAKVKYIEL